MDDKNWRECIVGDIVAPIKNALVGGPFGSDLVSRDYTSFGVPVIRGHNMGFGRWVSGKFVFVSQEKADNLKANIARPGDLVFTQRGTIGQVAIVPPAPFDTYLLSQSQMKFTPDNTKTDVKFLYYFFTSQEQQEYIRQNAIQTGVPHTNLEHLRNTPLALPPLPTQHAIARILGSLDVKIELNRQMNETLEAMARAIFQSWFVDFDPVRAKAGGRHPSGMDEETAALFPSEFEVVDGREVPKGWRILSLGDLCSLDKGVSYKGDFLSNEGTTMINLGCFTGEGNFSIDNLKFYTGEYRDRHIVKPGDIVIANTDITQKRVVLGSPAIVPSFDQFAHCIFTHHVYAIRFKKEFENFNYFVYFSLLNPEFRERAIGFATGTTVLALPRDTVLEHSFVMPDDRIIQIFNGKIKTVFSMIYNNIQQSRTLAQIRDALLPKLMSGEISVEKLQSEKHVEKKT